VSEWFIDVLPDIQKFGEGLVGALDDPEVKTAIQNMQTALGNLGLTIGTLFGSTQTDEAKGFMNFWIVLTGIIETLANLLSGLGAPIAAAFGNTKPMENFLDSMLNGLLGIVSKITGLRAPVVTPPANPRQSDKAQNVTINVNNGNVTAQQIANALNKANRVSGTNLIRA
jgi:hypothetical protein